MPFGFRPALRRDVAAGGARSTPRTASTRKEPKTTLEVPSVEVIDAILKLWRANKRHANVTLVLDVSGSMNDEDGSRIANAKIGAGSSWRRWATDDRFSLLVFNQEPALGATAALLLKTRPAVVTTRSGRSSPTAAPPSTTPSTAAYQQVTDRRPHTATASRRSWS